MGAARGREAPRSVRAALAVEGRLLRALAVLRVVVLVNAVALSVYRADNFTRPTLGFVLVGVMVAWTAFALWAYDAPERRGVALLVSDLVVAASLLALTPVVKGADFDASLPGFWVMGALLAWAIRYRWVGGLLASVVLVVTDVLSRSQFDQTDYGNDFLVLIGGPIVGFMAGSLQQMATERDLAQQAAAAAGERARLARVVHDGVLQVLALVQRRGAEIGGDAVALGRRAGEQETVLRTLIRAQDAVGDQQDDAEVDVASQLGRLGLRPGVDVAVPGGAVPLPAATGAELVAVVAACLDNVTRHVGEGAPAWVLLEDFADHVEVSVRDEGPGIPDGRLEQAEADGRLGVSESIRGRIRDVGGSARLTTGSFGTEWELTVPRRDAHRQEGPR